MSSTGLKLELSSTAPSPEAALDLLSLVDYQQPATGNLGDNDILVAVKSSTIAFVDLIMMTSQYQHTAEPPYTPGLEYAGEVIWTGSQVTKFQIGDRVMSDYQIVGPRSKGEYQQYGGWASYAVAPEHGLHHIPNDYSFAEACTLISNYETAYFALVKRAQIQKAETVTILGATGAAGLACVQMAKQLGAKVIAVGRSQEKLQSAKSNGADHCLVVDLPEENAAIEFKHQVRDLTNGEGCAVVIDTVGGQLGKAGLRTLAFGGRFIVVGWASNVATSGGRESFQADQLPTNIMQMKCLQVMGSPMVIYSMKNPEWRTKQLAAVLDLAKQGKIRPLCPDQFHISQFKEAIRYKLDGKAHGSCILNF